eukprot:gene31079-37562_t
MTPIGVLSVLVLMCFVTKLGRAAEFYDSLPSIPSYVDAEDDVKNSKGLVQVGGRIGQAIGASVLSFLAFNLGRTILRTIQGKPKDPANLATTFINIENQTVSDLKAEQEELWNAIMKIHEMQTEQKSELQLLHEKRGEELTSLTTTLSSLESKLSTLIKDVDSMRSKLNGLSLKRLDEIWDSQDSLREEVEKIAKSVETAEERIARQFTVQEKEFNDELKIFRGQLLKYVKLQQQLRQSSQNSTGNSSASGGGGKSQISTLSDATKKRPAKR